MRAIWGAAPPDRRPARRAAGGGVVPACPGPYAPGGKNVGPGERAVPMGAGAAVSSRVPPPPPGGVESTYAWLRLAASVCLGTIGGVGMWSVVVALPAVQAEFGVARAGASLPYALVTLGFGA